MDKLLFEFVVKAAKDGKSNIYTITSIVTIDNRRFSIPDELQATILHTSILQTSAFAKIKTTLTRRHQTRKIWITLTEELKNTYMDQDGNMQFKDYFLEEITEKTENASVLDESLVKILEKLSEKDNKPKQQNLKKVSEKFVIEKLTGINSNAHQWITVFKKEFHRFETIQDAERIEIFRLFLEKSCLDWYSSRLIKLKLNSEWGKWKENFCETYGNKGWSPIRYALSFKYKAGSLFE